jgi:hypothetical protein
MRRIHILVAVSIILVGCAKPTSRVSGIVMFDGKPLEQGSITFHPADGKGAAAAAEIEDGHFSVPNVTSGPKIVEVSSTKPIKSPQSSEDMAKAFAEAKAKGKSAATVEFADLIPRDAIGNNQKVELAPGSQTMNFQLGKGKKN